MPLRILVGTQWGDEGKGRIVDLLSAQSDIVARYNGGDNDTFVVKLNVSGSDLTYATFLGGSDADAGLGAWPDADGLAGRQAGAGDDRVGAGDDQEDRRLALAGHRHARLGGAVEHQGIVGGARRAFVEQATGLFGARLGAAAGDTLELAGPGGRLALPAAADGDVPAGAVFVPHAHRGAELNRLGVPAGAGLRVTVRRVGGPAA